MIKYECCYCHNTFPAKQAIDGYQQGYKVGFLCPDCGENIQAGLEDGQKLTGEQFFWTIVAFILFLPTVFTRNSEATISMLEYAISLNMLVFVAWIVFFLILGLMKPSLFSTTTFYTKPVPPK